MEYLYGICVFVGVVLERKPPQGGGGIELDKRMTPIAGSCARLCKYLMLCLLLHFLSSNGDSSGGKYEVSTCYLHCAASGGVVRGSHGFP